MAHETLTPARMEAFSDGVIAVIITIMVLDIHVPGREVKDHEALLSMAPLLLVYLLSFVQTGIYWVNHHYLVDGLKQVTHGILWSNLAVLFAMSLMPAATYWVGLRGINPVSMAVYGTACVSPAVPWIVLSSLICKHSGRKPAAGFGKQFGSLALYGCSVATAWKSPRLSLVLIGTVAVMWLIPPRRIVEMTRTHANAD